MNPFQFKGGLHDRTTNWVKFGNRWYSTEWGRFTQKDTLDAPLDSGNANRYAFAANDPINNADPLGLYSVTEGIAACSEGAFIDGLTGIAVRTTPQGVLIGMGLGCLSGIVVDAYAKSQPTAEERMRVESGDFVLDVYTTFRDTLKRVLR